MGVEEDAVESLVKEKRVPRSEGYRVQPANSKTKQLLNKTNNLAFNPIFYAGKRVFVTGHTGFKGSWLCLWLSSLGAEVTGYSLEPPTVPSMFKLCRVDRLVNSIRGDIRDLDRLSRVIKAARPEIVIHMAAQALVRLSYRDPVETYMTNVIGTVNLFEAVRRCNSARAVINVTTDKCYENRERMRGYSEDEALGGYDPYSSSKACSELVTVAYRNSFFNPADHKRHGVGVAYAREGNVIGGGDWALDRLVPDCVRSRSGSPTCVAPALPRNAFASHAWSLPPMRPMSNSTISSTRPWPISWILKTRETGRPRHGRA